jgi:hypothetical protein
MQDKDSKNQISIPTKNHEGAIKHYFESAVTEPAGILEYGLVKEEAFIH